MTQTTENIVEPKKGKELLELVRGILDAQGTPEADPPNLLDWIGVSDRELMHSKVIAKFLNPNGDHGQGDLFLKAFLSLADKKPAKFQPENGYVSLLSALDPTRVQVEIEYSIPPRGRRLDIVALLGKSGVLVIENKVWAAEADEQLSDYVSWANQQPGAAVVVFLTPDGADPKTAGDFSDQVVCLSYGDIAHWLRQCGQHLAPEVGWLVTQYATVCERINMSSTGELLMTSIPQGLSELISYDLSAAVALADNVDRYHSLRRKDFWNALLEKVTEALKKEGLSDQWRAALGPGFDHKLPGLSIFNEKAPENRPTPIHHGCYSVRIEQEGYRGLFLGVCRGFEGPKRGEPAPDEGRFTAVTNMGGNNLHEGAYWWAVWRWLNPGQKLVTNRREYLPALDECLKAEGQPQISAIADELIWWVKTCGDQIRELNEQYPVKA